MLETRLRVHQPVAKKRAAMTASAVTKQTSRFRLLHSAVVKTDPGQSHDFDCAFDYDLIGQILIDLSSHSHMTFLL